MIRYAQASGGANGVANGAVSASSCLSSMYAPFIRGIRKSVTELNRLSPLWLLVLLVSVAGAVWFVFDSLSTAETKQPVWQGISQQQVSQKMMAGNAKHWNAGFTVSADTEQLLVAIDIKLLPQDGIRTPALERTKQAWLQGIDQVWNNRFYLQLPDKQRLPIRFQVNFKSAQAFHEVVVRKGNANPNQHNWFLDTRPEVVAHEIGHMLGAYDEYREGAISPDPQPVKEFSLMAKNAGDGKPRTRHLHLLKQKLIEISGLPSLDIVTAEQVK